ncbi:hypothetical protein BJV77DRAFT_732996 [Russula vinacea]|nr:hypothetical protein BJV77DRAFT_732996 [Russula vinacea]
MSTCSIALCRLQLRLRKPSTSVFLRDRRDRDARLLSRAAAPGHGRELRSSRSSSVVTCTIRTRTSAQAPPPSININGIDFVLTNNGFSRVLDNSPPTHDGGDGIMPALAWKKSAVTRSVVSVGRRTGGPPVHTRVPPPPVPPVLAPNIPPRSVRRTVVVAQPPSRPTTTTSSSFRETSRPLVIRKQLPSHSLAAAGSSHVRSASGASGTLPVVGPVPAGIEALIGDIDRFAKDWTEMFDELSEGPEDGRLSNWTRLSAYVPLVGLRMQDIFRPITLWWEKGWQVRMGRRSNLTLHWRVGSVGSIGTNLWSRMRLRRRSRNETYQRRLLLRQQIRLETERITCEE